MPSTALKTEFAPAKRATPQKIEQQCRYLADSSMFSLFFDGVPINIMILNQERQAVFMNKALVDFIGAKDKESLCGLRPGEIFGCIHSAETLGGCGTTEFCKTCGAVKAILKCQKGERSVQECRITRGQDKGPLDFRVWATPFSLHSETATFFATIDISHEKRRRVLERIFFHDILNTAAGLKGFANLLANTEQDQGDFDELNEIVHRLSKRLIEEIKAQKELNEAENNELSVKFSRTDALQLLEEIADSYRGTELAENCRITIDQQAEHVIFDSDPVLLGRVINNMVKNALEAAQSGQEISLSCRLVDHWVQFQVNNPNYMTREVQLQVFQRSFSTKGAGRGLGTYSIKLLTERYLQGKVSFTSTPDKGTTFTASYPYKKVQGEPPAGTAVK